MYELLQTRAEIRFLDMPNGRKTPFRSGYRPLFNFTDVGTKISGRIDLIEQETFSVGMKGVVNITFIKGMIDDIHFKTGVKFTFDEGTEIFGEGVFL